MSKISDFLEESVSIGAFPGCTYVVGTSKSIIDSGAVGKLSADGRDTGTETIYDLASMTKPIASIALMKQLEEGLLCLDDTIETFLPSYEGHLRGKVTLFELLTHTSSIPGQVPMYTFCDTKQKLLDAIKYLPDRDTTKTPVFYSSQGMIVVGQIIEQVSGKTLDVVLDNYIFTPLEMKSTMFNPAKELVYNIAPTEECPWRKGKLIQGEVHDENAVILGGVCAHAGLFSIAKDLAKLATAMLTGNTQSGNKFLHNSIIDLMTRNHTSGLNLARGLGWQCRDKGSSPAGDLFSDISYGHTGFTGTSIWIDPKKDIYAVLLTNRIYPKRDNNKIIRVRHIFHNLAVLSCEENV